MLRSAVALLEEHGASATSVDRVLAHSGAPRGSVYHHFPQGRAQLIDEAVTAAGGFVGGLLHAAAQRAEAREDVLAAVDAFFALSRGRLLEREFRAGCPVVAVAVETNDDAPQLARTAAAVFGDWRQALAALLSAPAPGLAPERARRLAGLVIASLEGAVAMCRAERSITPLDDVATEVHELLADALGIAPG
jgi:AcrR family transcriptional regulator